MSERINQYNWWERFRRNVVKVWQMVYMPMRVFFIGEGAKEKNEEAEREYEAEQAAAEEAAMEESSEEEVYEEEPVIENEPEPEIEPEPEPETEPVAEEEEADMSGLSDDEAALAAEIIARLQAEANADAAQKQAEIDAARQHAEDLENENYNAATNSFSGEYGTGPVDDDTMDAVSAILKQNDRSGIDDLLK